jgi:HAD superfamily hydrolase (TIGR01509 family)
VKTVQAFLVDLDGTLADTASVNSRAYASALAEVGVLIDIDRLANTIHGKSWRQFLPAILDSAGAKIEPALVAKRKSSIYAEMVSDVSINQPLVSLLESFRPETKIALVTTAARASVLTILEYHELTGLFDVIVTGDEVASHKPDPEAYLLAIEQIKVAASQCLAFEDSDVGAASARAAGVGVLRIVFPSPM